MTRPARSTIATLAVAALFGCIDDPTQVIEETEFAASLGVDLTQMEKLETGVYIQDLEVGPGIVLVLGSEATLTYTGWLADGVQFDNGTLTDVISESSAIPGFIDGILGMRVGGTRLIVIPPERAYGDEGFGAIPPGAILVFQVTLDEIVTG